MIESAYGVNLSHTTDVEMRYVRRWADWFRQEDRLQRLDELRYVLPDDASQEVFATHPATLLRREHEARLEWQRREAILNAEWNERQAKIEKTRTPSFAYEVSKLFKDLQYGDVSIGPVKTYGQLQTIASELRNCSLSYHSNIVLGNSALIYASQEGRPVALGELRLQRGKVESLWAQRSGPNNKRLGQNLITILDKYIEEGVCDG